MIKIKTEVLDLTEKQLASEFVASEFWPVYKKLVNHAYENIREINLGAATWDECLINRGRAAQIKWELNQFRKINKDIELERAKRKAKGKKNAAKEG